MHRRTQCGGSNPDNPTPRLILELLSLDIFGLTKGSFGRKGGGVGDEGCDDCRAGGLGGKEGVDLMLGEGLGGVVID